MHNGLVFFGRTRHKNSVQIDRTAISVSSIQYTKQKEDMNSIKEIRGLKCPNHEYVRDNYHFTYQPAYPGAKPLSSTRCIKCGYTMSLHKVQK